MFSLKKKYYANTVRRVINIYKINVLREIKCHSMNLKKMYHIFNIFSDYFPLYVEPLVTQSMQWCDTYSEPLFIPMTSWLPSPYLPLVASLDCVDGANLIAPLRNNQHILCSYGLLDIAMYHVPSKKLLKLFSGKYYCPLLVLNL